MLVLLISPKGLIDEVLCPTEVVVVDNYLIKVACILYRNMAYIKQLFYKIPNHIKLSYLQGAQMGHHNEACSSSHSEQAHCDWLLSAEYRSSPVVCPIVPAVTSERQYPCQNR